MFLRFVSPLIGSLDVVYLFSPEKKKNHVKIIVFRLTVSEIAMILKVVPTFSVSGCNFTLATLSFEFV